MHALLALLAFASVFVLLYSIKASNAALEVLLALQKAPRGVLALLALLE